MAQLKATPLPQGEQGRWGSSHLLSVVPCDKGKLINQVHAIAEKNKQRRKSLTIQEGDRTWSKHITCSSQFAENVSPGSNQLVHGAPPSVNEPVRSVLHELTGDNCAQTKVTITLIAK